MHQLTIAITVIHLIIRKTTITKSTMAIGKKNVITGKSITMLTIKHGIITASIISMGISTTTEANIATMTITNAIAEKTIATVV